MSPCRHAVMPSPPETEPPETEPLETELAAPLPLASALVPGLSAILTIYCPCDFPASTVTCCGVL